MFALTKSGFSHKPVIRIGQMKSDFQSGGLYRNFIMISARKYHTPDCYQKEGLFVFVSTIVSASGRPKRLLLAGEFFIVEITFHSRRRTTFVMLPQCLEPF